METAPFIPSKPWYRRFDVWLFLLSLDLWIALAVAVSIKAMVQGADHSVYPVFAWGSRHWWADLPLHAFYPALQIDIYRYSPTFAIMFTPFAILPDWLGASLWGILSVVTMVCSLHMMARELLPGSWPLRREAGFLALTALGSMSGIWSSQSTSLLLAMVILAAFAVKRQRWWTVSILLALPVFIKIWPIAAALLLMACWPKQLTWRFAIVFVTLALLPFLTRPFGVVVEQYHEWYVSLLQQEKGRWPSYRDAWTIWENIWPPVSRHGYLVLQLVSSLSVLAWCLYQKRRTTSTDPKRGQNYLSHPEIYPSQIDVSNINSSDPFLLTMIIAIWACWQLLFGPGSEQLTYGLIAPTAAWAVMVAFADKKHRVWTTITWLILTLVGCGEIENLIIAFHPAATMLLPLGVLSVTVWLVVYGCRTIAIKKVY
jgi:alpha-1,2-mannosyltransferase